MKEKNEICYLVLDFLIVLIDLNPKNDFWKIYFFCEFSLIRNFIEKRPVVLNY